MSNSTDFVPTLYYYGQSKGIEIELYLNGKSVQSLENLFEDWNRSLSLQNEILRYDE